MSFLIDTWELVVNVAWQIGLVFYESSFFILIGLMFAGLLHEFISLDFVAKYLGKKGFGSIFWASVLGAPLPLCSCSVLPIAATLRKKGASKPATASFIISVPETGVDSVAVSYGLMGPVMAIYRPIVALTTAMVAGLACAFVSRKYEDNDADENIDVDLHHHHHHHHDHGHDHHHHHHHDHDHDLEQETPPGWRPRLYRITEYGFKSMLDDIAFWVFLGLVITGLMLGLLPEDFFSSFLQWDNGILPMLAMLLIAVPLYTCASMSTPVAAGLIVSGLSPGAALVYLLAGPATSIATINIVSKMLGRRMMVAYLGSIILVAISAGLLLNLIAADTIRSATEAVFNEPDSSWEKFFKVASMVIFLALIAMSFIRRSYLGPVADLKGQFKALGRASLLVKKQALIGGAVYLLYLIIPSFVLQVPPGNTGMIKQLGQVVERDLTPGLYFHLPYPLGEGITVDSSNVRMLIVGPAKEANTGYSSTDNTYLTVDENIVFIMSAVSYRISDAYKYHFESDQNTDLLEKVAQRTLITEVLERPIDAIFTVDRGNLEKQFKEKLIEEVASISLGYEVLDARLVYVHAPDWVHDAFRGIASSIEDRLRLVYEADGNAKTLTAAAEGRSASIVSQAMTDAVEATTAAQGQISRFVPLAQVHEKYPHITEKRMILDVQEKSLAASKLYINMTDNGKQGVDLWLSPSDDQMLKFKYKE